MQGELGRNIEMSKYNHRLSFPTMALALALLFSLILLAACGTGTGARNPLPSTTANQPGSDKVTPEKGTTDTVTPNATAEFDCANVNQIPAVECEALVALYSSSDGPSWVDHSGWLATVTACTWSGIECKSGHISGISLGYNHLTGSLPPELGNLSHLRGLSLSSNHLYGPIPAELGNLTELDALDVSGNQLAGPVPAELGDLPKLRTLSLGNNQFSGSIPPALGNIRSLHALFLSHNQLSGVIPEELGNLAQLNALYLSHNQLSGVIPDALGRLSRLSELDVSYNQLSGPVPEFIAQISERRLWGNQLDGTITADGDVPFSVDFMGVHYSADPSLANSIWPEVKPATQLPEVQEGPAYWLAIPEHIRFTFADSGLPTSRQQMGFNLAAEGQILVIPMAELADINPLVQKQIEMLRNLLAESGTVPSGELPLLPLTNSAQVFHAQAQYLVSGNIKGLRFISQHSQDPAPILLSQELFYTFQGFTADGAYYVAAFFPLTTAVLPNTIEVDNWDAFHANYDTYLSETTRVLEQLLPTEFTPDLTLLDAVITSLQVEPDSALSGGATSSSSSY
jgi:hypothetical protein